MQFLFYFQFHSIQTVNHTIQTDCDDDYDRDDDDDDDAYDVNDATTITKTTTAVLMLMLLLLMMMMMMMMMMTMMMCKHLRYCVPVNWLTNILVLTGEHQIRWVDNILAVWQRHIIKRRIIREGTSVGACYLVAPKTQTAT